MKQDKNESSIVIYTTEDGQARLAVKIEGETVWLTQDQMAELFDKSKSTVNEHIKNIYSENELILEQTMRKFGNSEFSRSRFFRQLLFFINIFYMLING